MGNFQKSKTIVNRLNALSEEIEKDGKLLHKIMIVVGIIAGLNSAITAYNDKSLLDYFIDNNFETFIAVIKATLKTCITWTFYEIIEYIVYKTISSLLAAMADITQNISFIAESTQNIHIDSDKSITGETATKEHKGVITCPKCGLTQGAGRTECWDCGADLKILKKTEDLHSTTSNT